MWKCTNKGKDVLQIVQTNSGMSLDNLLNDDKKYEVKHLDEAAAIILSHKDRFIRLWGDYDVDGITASSIMGLIFDSAGCKRTETVIPRRFTDGYGVNMRSLEGMAPGDLLITVDNGIAAIDVMAKAKENGIHTLILDHHQPVIKKNSDGTKSIVLPDADLLIDPHITESDFHEYCGAGICYKLACKMITDQKTLDQALSLAAIGTVADAVRLVDDNRKIVKEGLKVLSRKNSTVGMNLLLSKLDLDNVKAEDIGFKIGPVMNASGRLEDDGSQKVFDVVSFNKEEESLSKLSICANRLLEMNEKRKKETENGMQRAEEVIAHFRMADNNFIVLYDPLCPEGIAGILAGKVSEKYHVPSIVYTNTSNDDILKGSGRAPAWINLKQVLDENADLIYRYGGHPGACGISILRSNLSVFRLKLNQAVRKPFNGEPPVYYDIKCTLEEIPGILEEIEKYEPYGAGNPKPKVCIDNYILEPKYGKNYQTLGDKQQHVKFYNHNADAVGFNLIQKYQELGKPSRISLIGEPSYNTYRNNVYIQLRITDMKAKVVHNKTSLAAKFDTLAKK